ncbi:hypothetical protein, partial [Acetivibrio cellulolyticus]|uniref:hypothetical protein n=1 Tax=Acetivibrio cellulolyticus TaxID=35830 RepID=UPI0001E2C6F0
MNKKLKLFAIITMLTVTVSSTGCSMLFKKDEKPPEQPKKVETPDTSVEEDKKVLEILNKYYESVYSVPFDSYAQNVVTGNIPETLKPFIAKRTIDEGNGNPEIGIHLPRVVEINGLSIVGYEILKDKDNKAVINSGFIGKTGENFLYFVQLGLKAKALENSLFDQYYVQNPVTRLYDKIAGKAATGDLFENIKIEVKYDVEVAQENGQYKIVTAKEANYKPGLKNRLFKMNNEFMTRKAYLDLNIEADKKVFDSEKAVIEGFFNNLTKLDKERMILLKSKWEAGNTQFTDFLNTIGAMKVNEKDALLLNPQDYKVKINYSAFPLQVNMEKINKLNNIKVQEHPGYSSKNKRYFVSFDASLLKSNGMVGAEEVYYYDYFVTLKNVNDNLYIDSIKINEFYKK